VIDGWSVRLIPSLAAGVFTDVKLRAPRCNLRVLGAIPSPTYNNLLRLESGYGRVLAQLHATYATPRPRPRTAHAGAACAPTAPPLRTMRTKCVVSQTDLP
jgi:hypothetical protein